MENKNHFRNSSVSQEIQKSDYETLGLIPTSLSIIYFYSKIVNFKYMEKQFNQNEYIREYNKEHYKQFKAKIKNDDMEQLNKLLKENNLNKTQFVLKAKELLENGYFKNKKEPSN